MSWTEAEMKSFGEVIGRACGQAVAEANRPLLDKIQENTTKIDTHIALHKDRESRSLFDPRATVTRIITGIILLALSFIGGAVAGKMQQNDLQQNQIVKGK